MNTKFIQILIPLITLISCREYDEVTAIEISNERVEILEKKAPNEGLF